MNFKKIICGALVAGACMASLPAMAGELSALQYFERGVLSQTHDKIDEAIGNYNKAAELDANYAPTFYNRGICLSKMGEKELALADFNRAIELNPKYVAAYINRGNYYLEAGDKAKAAADYDAALAVVPSNKQALEGKAKCQ